MAYSIGIQAAWSTYNEYLKTYEKIHITSERRLPLKIEIIKTYPFYKLKIYAFVILKF